MVNLTSRSPEARLSQQPAAQVMAPPIPKQIPSMLEGVLAELMRGGNGGGRARPDASTVRNNDAQTRLYDAQAREVGLKADRAAATGAFTQAAYGFYDPQTKTQVPGAVDQLREQGGADSAPDAILSLANRFGIPQDEAEAIAARMLTATAMTPTSPMTEAFTGAPAAASTPAPPPPVGTGGAARFDAETDPAPAPPTATPSPLQDVFTGPAGLGGKAPTYGTERESQIAGLRVATGAAPFGATDGVDVGRLQGNIDTDYNNEMQRNTDDNDAQRDVARIGAGATLGAAKIRADADTANSNNALTQTFTTPNLKPEDLNAYVDMVLPPEAEKTLPPGTRGAIARRIENYIQQGFPPADAAQRAGQDLLQSSTTPKGWFGTGGDTRYNVNPSPTPQPALARAPSRTVVRNGGDRQPTAPLQVTDAASYARVPGGATYIDPNGVTRTKPGAAQ